MKCKRCGEEINLTVFGIPEDVCYGCAIDEEKQKAAELNVETAKKKYNIEEQDMTTKKMVDAIFDQFKDKQLYIDALNRAAEEAYQSEMVDTNMEILEIVEAAEKYKYYENDEEREHAIRNCSYETKEEWIADKINGWLDPKYHW